MRLPAEILTMIFRMFVLVDPPEIGQRRSRGNTGWLVLLWVCSRFRAIINFDASLFAMAYTHLPGQMEVFEVCPSFFVSQEMMTDDLSRCEEACRECGPYVFAHASCTSSASRLLSERQQGLQVYDCDASKSESW